MVNIVDFHTPVLSAAVVLPGSNRGTRFYLKSTFSALLTKIVVIYSARP